MAEAGAVDVGTAYVSIIPSARGFAAKLRTALAAEIKNLDVGELISERIGGKSITVPVKLDADAAGLSEKVRAQVGRTTAKVKVDVDVDKQTAASRIGTVLKALSGALPDVGGLSSKVADLGGSLQKAAGSSAQLGGSLAGAFQSAAGPIGLVVGGLVVAAGALAAVASAAVLAVPAISAVSGAIAAIPAAAVGGGAALGTLALGLRGISDAFKPVAKTGGGSAGEDPASRARRIAGAERGIEAARRGIAAATRGVQSAERGYQESLRTLASAQQRAASLQGAINKARRDAIEDLDDLGRAMRGALLDEEDAALSVTEAERALNFARERGNIPEIQRADLAYRQSLLTLENSKDATDDLGKAQADAARKGINGSDKVQQALAEQADALEAVRQAQLGVVNARESVVSANDSLTSSYDGLASANDSLAEAQKKQVKTGGAAVAQAIKLAPAAQKFVDAVKALGPAFERLRLGVQERLFAGLDRTVTRLGERWIPQLEITLGGYADTFNRFFKRLGAGLSQPKIIGDLAAGAEGARKGLQRILDAVSGPLVEAFATLSRAAAPFMEALGDELAKVVESFSKWVRQGERSGGLQRFFANATQSMRDIFSLGRPVASIIGSLLSTIIGQPLTRAGEKSPLIQFRDGLQSIADYLKDPGNQQRIRGFIADVQSAVGRLLDFAKQLTSIYLSIRKALGGDNTSSIGQEIGTALVAGVIVGLQLGTQVLIGAVKAVFNGVIRVVKGILGIASPSRVMATIGAQIIDGLIQGIGARFGALISVVGQIPGRIRSAIGAAGNVLFNTGRNIGAGLANGISSMAGIVADRAGRLGDIVGNAFRGAGSLLYNAGRAIVQGLINGIASLVGRLGSYLNDLGRFIQDNKGPLDADRKLLVPAGRAIMQGLIGGIASQRGALADELGGVTGMFAGVGPELAAGPFAAFGTSTVGPAALEIGFRSGATGDKIIDGIRDHIVVRYRGSVDDALGSKR